MNIREKIQQEANEILDKHNDIGLLALSMGTGKSKIVIDRIKERSYKNILITGYRSTLKDNWISQLKEWLQTFRIKEDSGYMCYGQSSYFMSDGPIITLQNVQTVYKWTKEQLSKFDLVILDEIHEIATEKYGKLIINVAELGIARIALSGTPDLKNKKDFYDKYCPLIMEYYDVEGDITNEVNVIVFEYELSDEYKVLTGNKTMKWYIGEAKQYAYLTEKYEEAKALMYQEINRDRLIEDIDYFTRSLYWMKGSKEVQNPFDPTTTFTVHFTKEQQEIGRKFFYATKARKEFLWNLNSSATIARLLKNKILNSTITPDDCVSIQNGEVIMEDPYSLQLKRWNNKVLLFSQLTEQCNKLSEYRVHSKTGKSIKQSEGINQEILDRFNKGEIREISSVKSLTTGVNLKDLNWIIVESFDSSDVKLNQIRGRGRRLELGETSNMIIIVPKNTQAETWVKSGLGDMDCTVINNINDLKVQ